ncbi:FAD-dependent oxidoreductase [Streptomyces sp. NBC_00841]|uniref:FAD-dependent oxidoreductase n=1 Tax=Streptomyces sp. NBC_00841 TaxID=2975847 RepID=UPI002DD84BE3|nr:FAD-dependent oxidoreductase [Streptomyces sp. NBC_00841]WRZ97022.1 FAD-dependent oxidoreductase [Streptomyces sp. NBC_00841]
MLRADDQMEGAVVERYDVVVLGTGAAGLTAALAAASAGASVGLFEKADEVGGTTARSGGIIWMPGNEYAAQAGVTDSREQALAYLDSLSNGSMRQEMVEAFVDNVAPTLDWLRNETPLRLKLVPRYPDYHPEHPGGLPGGGRSLEPELFSTDGLGPWLERIVGDPRRLYVHEIPSGGGGTGVIDPEIMQERTAAAQEGLGRGLVAALLQGCLVRGIEPRTGMRATALLEAGGRVDGVRFESASGTHQVRADKAVVIATGGFEHAPELVRDFLRGPIGHPPGVPSNTGDGLRMAMRLGARLSAMHEAWWVPVVLAQAPDGTSAPALLLRERTLPGTLMVNGQGKRFTNEAANYNALGAAFHAFDVTTFSYANDPAWLVLDDTCVKKYGVFGTTPGTEAPGWLTRADTLDELAERIGVPADALAATVKRFNDGIQAGHDPDFHRGESVYDGWVGDQNHYRTPRATLGTVATGPFYATRVHPSTLGTKGGPRTTTDGQVLRVDDTVIDGLYAVGNAMAAPTGMAYGGAGGTLGPAMVFARLAGRHAAQH